jgi:CheY-like chemotaxis protein
VVEDFEQMRRWVCSTLTSLQQLQVICEVTDGQDAVVKAEELQPDLIVLDIGLPTLNEHAKLWAGLVWRDEMEGTTDC